jgi:amino acid adenylation domain-containing protein
MGMTVGGKLQLEWSYSEKLHRAETIGELAEQYVASLRELIWHCRDHQAGGYTPSDFPLAHLEQDEIDRWIGADSVEDIYRLSPMQQGMLFHAMYGSGSAAYFTQVGCRIDGLELSAFQHAWQRVVERHSVLRTEFLWEGLKEPVQVVRRQIALRWHQEDWRHLQPSEQELRWQEHLKQDQQVAFDFRKAPLLRLTLMRVAENSYYFAWIDHHILVDGWSHQIVLRELFALYAAYSKGRKLELPSPRPYRPYIAWLETRHQHEAEDFWRKELRGFSALTRMRIERELKPSDGMDEYARIIRTLPTELTEKLAVQARRHQLTMNSIVQAAWGFLLSRYSGEDDVVFGATVSGRSSPLPGIDSMVGLFINTLPVRVRLRNEESIRALGQRLQEQQVRAREYECTPLVNVQRWSEIEYGSPLFDHIVVFENYPVDASLSKRAGNVLNISGLQSRFHAHYPLVMGVDQGDGMTFSCQYHIGRFEHHAIERLQDHLRMIVQAMALFPERPVEDISLLSAGELRQVVVEWNPVRTSAPPLCVHQMFEQQVRRTPEAVALLYQGRSLSYRELNRRANQLAHYLHSLGVGIEARVGICVERSPELVIAMLAILKAGGAYVPLDWNYPAERLRYMLQDARVAVLITQSELRLRIPVGAGPLFCMDTDWERLEQESDENPAGLAVPENVAYIIYTSGSTGQPKGSEIPHRSIPGFFSGVGYARFDQQTVLLQHSSTSWDVLTLEVWPALLTGGCSVLYPGRFITGPDLREYVQQHGVTTVWLTAALFNSILEDGSESLKGLREVMIGGEQVSVPHVRRALASFPGTQIVNGYGPSECTVFSSCYRIPESLKDAVESIPIGSPIGDRRTYLLDRWFRPVPVGIVGEIYIGGPSVARGYLNQPALTAERFVPDCFSAEPGARLYRTGDLARWMPDGNLQFIGREDGQVKVRGYRIEVGEIESVLLDHPKVAQAAVVVRANQDGEKQLVAYVVSRTGAEPPANSELRTYLDERLPQYMVPDVCVVVENFPLTATGKLDRKALPEARNIAAPGTYTRARTSVEEMLCSVWCDALKQDRIGIDDNFFALGGHSLVATRIVSRILRDLHVQLPLAALFDAPNIRALAARVEDELQKNAGTEWPPLRRSGRNEPLPLSFAQQRLWFIDQLEPGNAAYNIPFAVRLSGRLDKQAVRWSIGEIVRRHEVLRTCFPMNEGVPMQKIADDSGLEIREQDLRERDEKEREEVARRIVQEESELPFDLAHGPLIRVKLLQLGEQDHLLLVVMHHVVCDEWSVQIMVAEFTALYDAHCQDRPSPLQELEVQYADYAKWQRDCLQGPGLERHLEFWKKQLQGVKPVPLPFDHTRPEKPARRGATSRCDLTPELSSEIRALARSQGVSVYMVLLAALQVLLKKYSGQDDVAVGTFIANRTLVETEALIGFFANTLILRTDLSGDPTFLALLTRVRDVTLGAFAHQNLPFDLLVEAVRPERHTGYVPLAQMVFSFRQKRDSVVRLNSLRAEDFQGGQMSRAKFDLFLQIFDEPDALQGTWEYDTSLFESQTIEAMNAHFLRLLQSIVIAPGSRISSLQILSDEALGVLKQKIEVNDLVLEDFSL